MTGWTAVQAVDGRYVGAELNGTCLQGYVQASYEHLRSLFGEENSPAAYGETKVDAALLQPVIDLAVKYGDMQPVRAGDLIWQG